MAHHNSVLALRQQQIAAARRPFAARGAKLKRCERCLLSESLCICDNLATADDCQAAVCLLMYHNESFKPSNTGRLIADVVPQNFAFRWDRTEPDPAFLALINDERYAPFVVFPEDELTAHRVVADLKAHIQSEKRTPLFIFLDGTWREAKKMMRKSPYLDALPVVSITPERLSEYRLRVAPHAHQLATAEVASLVLAQAGEDSASDKLNAHFADFRAAYIEGKRR